MGASHTWIIDSPARHKVEIQHATHSGRVCIKIDGIVVFQNSASDALWDLGFDHEFTIDDQPARIRIKFGGSTPTYELWVDGRLQESTPITDYPQR